MSGRGPQETRLDIMREALGQRLEFDDNWPKGFRVFTGRHFGEYEFGPYLPRVWRWAVTLKAVACYALRRERKFSLLEDAIEVCAVNEESYTDFEGIDPPYAAWISLQVLWGWRPRTWYVYLTRESN